jgi:hypothetical protein
MSEADFSNVGREVRRVLGPTTWTELGAVLARRGRCELPDRLLGFDLSDVLYHEHDVRHVGNDEVVATREQATGGVVVGRVSASLRVASRAHGA